MCPNFISCNATVMWSNTSILKSCFYYYMVMSSWHMFCFCSRSFFFFCSWRSRNWLPSLLTHHPSIPQGHWGSFLVTWWPLLQERPTSWALCLLLFCFVVVVLYYVEVAYKIHNQPSLYLSFSHIVRHCEASYSVYWMTRLCPKWVPVLVLLLSYDQHMIWKHGSGACFFNYSFIGNDCFPVFDHMARPYYQ